MKATGILFFDTETTGLVERELPLEDASQPRIVELAGVLTTWRGKFVSCYSTLVEQASPIPPEVTAIHGITTEMCEEFGEMPRVAVKRLAEMASFACLMVAHNRGFDGQMLRIECLRAGLEYESIFKREDLDVFCTMKASTSLCAIPKPSGRAGHKWPKLEEALDILCSEKLVDSHRATGDVQGCMKLFDWLRKNDPATMEHHGLDVLEEKPEAPAPAGP